MTNTAISPEVNLSGNDKPLDHNRYATKKTIAQGMLDIALLTANASQLKYILQVGHKHEFYSLMLGLITTSIILQVITGVLYIVVGRMNARNSNNAMILANLNHLILSCVTVVMFVNIIKMGFGLDLMVPFHSK